MELVASAAILSTLVGGAAVVTLPLVQTSCEQRVEMRQDGPVEITVCEDGTQEVRPAHIVMKAAPGTGGLVFRDEQGNDLGSGIGEKQTFMFTHCGPKGSGLVNVYQLDSAEEEGIAGGWGSLYSGYIKAAYTEKPSSFPCK